MFFEHIPTPGACFSVVNVNGFLYFPPSPISLPVRTFSHACSLEMNHSGKSWEMGLNEESSKQKPNTQKTIRRRRGREDGKGEKGKKEKKIRR